MNPAALISSKTGFRPDIAALRALAVAAVVLFHFGISVVPGGFIGVDVFFVISGFLMTSILTGAAQRGRLDIVGFYVGRIRRIVPAIVVMTICTLAAGSFLLLPKEYEQLGWDAISANTFTINFAFARTTDYFAQPFDQRWFLHCWSLAVEIQFYLVIPFVVLGAMRFAPRRGVRNSLLIIAVLSLIASCLQTWADAASAFYLPTTRAWEFAAGGLVSTLRPLAVWRRTAAALGLATITAAIVGYDQSIVYPGLWPLAPVIGTALVIWARVENRVVSAVPVQVLGDISYSVYLWHWPVLMVCNALMPNGGPVALTVEIAASLALSVLTYRYIETPFRSRGRGAGFRPLATIAAGLCGVVLASGTVITLDGLPGRVPADILRIVNILPPESEWRSGRCFLRSDQDFSKLAPNCLAKDSDPRPRLLLWGDSLAAHLYPGLMAQPWIKQYAVEQITASNCNSSGSIPEPDVIWCSGIKQGALDLLKTQKPAYVMLTAPGSPSSISNKASVDTITSLAVLVSSIKRATAGQIIVVGPPPHWAGGLRAAFARESFERKKLVSMISIDDLRKRSEWDQLLQAAVVKAGGQYISLTSKLCNEEKCLTLVPDGHRQSLIQFDEAHFTLQGSSFVASTIIGPALNEQLGIANTDSFNPIENADGQPSKRPPPEELPQHYELSLGQNFEIQLKMNFNLSQIASATILQNYDSMVVGFSLEYVSKNIAAVFARMEDSTTFAKSFDLLPNMAHQFRVESHAGHLKLTVDGVVVVDNTQSRMAQASGDLWVGGSGIFAGRDLSGTLVDLKISGDVEQH